jgi:hypothetical protein
VRIAALPPPGINNDDTEYSAPGVWVDASNIRFYHGRPESVGNEVDLQSAALETYTSIRAMLAYKIGSTVYLAVAGDGTLHRVNTADWTRTDIEPASGYSPSSTPPNLAMFGDILLIGGGRDTLFASTAGAQAVEISNAPDQISKMLVTPSRQVMALGCNEEISGTFNGRCIRWSDIEDYTDWTTTSSNNAGEYILPGQENIVSACLLGDYIVIWTEGSLWLGQYIGQPGQTYLFTRIASASIVSGSAYATFEGAVYWMSRDYAFHAYQVGGAPVPIPCPLQVQRNIVFSGEENAMARRRFGEIWFFYTSSGGTQNAYAAYCVHESQAQGRPIWFRGSMSCTAAIDDALLADGLNMGDSHCIRIAEGSNQKLIAFDRQDGGGTPISWSAQTSYYYVDEGERRSMITRYYHDRERQDASITVEISAQDHPNGGGSATEALTVAAADTRKDFRLSGKMISYTLSGSDLFRLGKPAFDVVQLGTR